MQKMMTNVFDFAAEDSAEETKANLLLYIELRLVKGGADKLSVSTSANGHKCNDEKYQCKNGGCGRGANSASVVGH